jgi:hypothetical protein
MAAICEIGLCVSTLDADDKNNSAGLCVAMAAPAVSTILVSPTVQSDEIKKAVEAVPVVSTMLVYAVLLLHQLYALNHCINRYLAPRSLRHIAG